MPDLDRPRRIKEERVAAAAQGIKDCRVHWIPETVHDIGYHKPQELASAILEFLAEDAGDLPSGIIGHQEGQGGR
jgi:hypothetical protein